MKISRHLSHVLTVAAALAVTCAGARAENWQDTRHTTLVDVDSIHKEPDGLVYYMEKQKYPDPDSGPNEPQKAAYDCKKHIAYSAYSLAYESDWRSKGRTAIPGTMGMELLDFVCSRVK